MNVSTSQEHKKGTSGPYNFGLITISTSRFQKYGSVSMPEDAEDGSGSIMRDIIETNGHNVSKYMLVDDSTDAIKNSISSALESDVDIVITSGGTGLTPQDVTIESVSPMFEKDIPGFGELFRYKSIDQIGTAVILTRACAGVIDGKAVFCLPGSPNAVRLAVQDIIIPEAGHIVRHVCSK